MDMTVIVWVGLGVLIFALSFILPKKKEELDEDTKKFAGEQIRDILNTEIAGMRSKIDDVVSETIEESSSQTERALEKLTNEKMMAINEYSDTVIEDINTNHKEVLFLYDMLNDKHVTIRNTVTEVENAMSEITQTAKDIEISAKEAAKRADESKEAAERAAEVTNLAEKAAQRTAQNMDMDIRHIVEDMIRGRVEETMEKTALPMIQERVDAILEDATLLMEQKPKILINNVQSPEGKTEPVQEGKVEEVIQEESAEREAEPETGSEFVQGITQNAPQIVIAGEDENNRAYYLVEAEQKETEEPVSETSKEAETEEISETDMAPEGTEEVIQEAQVPEEPEVPEKSEESQPEEVSVLQEQSKVDDTQAKAEENVTEPEKESGGMQRKISALEMLDKTGRNNNEKILALHKEGMSDLAIAKELRLGVGEVKLVVDLFKGM